MLEPPAAPEIRSLAEAMRARRPPDDAAFDRFLPLDLRLASPVHWTPLVVAARVASWVEELGIRSIVDLGSGAGKLCVAVALGAQCELVGIEQRPRLVSTARSLARSFGVDDRVRFVAGVIGEVEVPAADAYYLYNPFGENTFPDAQHLDDQVELSDERFERDVRAVEALLAHVPIGTHLITYNGFGGRAPLGFEEVRVDRTLPNMLRMRKKVSVDGAHRTGSFAD